jgi:hypothetical protein
MQTGLDSNYYAELNNDRETVAEMRTREAEEARKGHEEWERVRVSLLAGKEESGRTLNQWLIDEYEWAYDLEQELNMHVHVIDLFKLDMLAAGRVTMINKQASILASIIVGADHE